MEKDKNGNLFDSNFNLKEKLLDKNDEMVQLVLEFTHLDPSNPKEESPKKYTNCGSEDNDYYWNKNGGKKVSKFNPYLYKK